MLLTLLLLLGLSVCTVAGDKKLALGGTEARPWEGVVPSIRLQLQEVKRGKESQFFGLMGKKVGRIKANPLRTHCFLGGRLADLTCSPISPSLTTCPTQTELVSMAWA
ncbi:PREDICTED: tachykinin-4 [Miniopterus natalensis]|uniref:tachykinin-4 n=1 Tax=Miniopterus natalensis TaxID=291302 RepID=UPI0007A6B2E7|nr:PREDICTED: tachykinin-4 [Miniopterus natalensis]